MLIADHVKSGKNAGAHGDEADHRVHQLVPLPESFEVAIAGDLKEGQQTPRGPHQPSMDQERLILFSYRVYPILARRRGFSVLIDSDLVVI